MLKMPALYRNDQTTRSARPPPLTLVHGQIEILRSSSFFTVRCNKNCQPIIFFTLRCKKHGRHNMVTVLRLAISLAAVLATFKEGKRLGGRRPCHADLGLAAHLSNVDHLIRGGRRVSPLRHDKLRRGWPNGEHLRPIGPCRRVGHLDHHRECVLEGAPPLIPITAAGVVLPRSHQPHGGTLVCVPKVYRLQRFLKRS